jgi:hypothetical protein
MIHALRYAEKLEKAGFSKEQAKASIQIWIDLMDQNFATKGDFKEYYFMTKNDWLLLRHEFKEDLEVLRGEVKADIAELRAEVKVDVAALRAEVKADIAEVRSDMRSLENRLTIKLGAMMAVSFGIVSIIVTLLK